jgi:hypothetical protein
MKVWILSKGEMHEGGSVLGVFADRDLARGAFLTEAHVIDRTFGISSADRDALVRVAALNEAEAAIRAQAASPLASALFNNGAVFAADLVHDLATTTPTNQEKAHG